MMNKLIDTIKETAKHFIKGEISMKYNKDSQTVISWADMIESGKKKIENVPTLFGLRKVVAELLDYRSKEKTVIHEEEYVEELEEVVLDDAI